MRISSMISELLDVMDAEGDLEMVRVSTRIDRVEENTFFHFSPTRTTDGSDVRRVFDVKGFACIADSSNQSEPDTEDGWVTPTDVKVLVWAWP